VVETQGDLDRISSLQEIGGRGVFTSAIERAVFDGSIDGAIHSAKDMPTALDPAVPLVAIPLRDDPRDVLVTRHKTTLSALPPNPVIGSSSRRRAVQVRLLRPDARIVSIRGNVDTRLRKSEADDLDGVVLAAAGLHRLGLADHINEYFAVEDVVPSPGQGAIAIQARVDSDAAQVLACLNNATIADLVSVERAFLAAVGVGCTAAVGALAVSSGDAIRFVAMLSDEAGERTSREEVMLAHHEAIDHVRALADQMKRAVTGGTTRLHPGVEVPNEPDLFGARVVVTRPRHQAGQLLEILEQRGATALALPLIRVEALENPAALDFALRDAAARRFDWVVFTSANAVYAVATRLGVMALNPSALSGARIATVGPSTAHAATRAGFTVTLTGSGSTAADLAREIATQARPGERVLYPRSHLGRDDLVTVLEGAGLEVLPVDAYRTVIEECVDPRLLDQVKRGEIDAITFSSPSSVHTLTTLVGDEPCMLGSVPAICSGPITAAAARDAGLNVAATSANPGPEAMAQAIVDTLGRAHRTSVVG
jgi:hydroxymethylbilane synthase